MFRGRPVLLFAPLVAVTHLGGACTRTNPNFDLGATPEGSDGPNETGDDATSTDGVGATSVASVDGTDGMGGSTGELACELHDHRPIDIVVEDPIGELPPPVDGPCESGIAVQGVYEVFGGVLEILPCNGCKCQGEPEIFVSLGDFTEFPDGMFGCGDILVWEGDVHGEGCGWQGVLVFDVVPDDPIFVASNHRDTAYIPFSAPGVAAEQACDGETICDISPGKYELVFGDAQVAVDEVPVLTDLGTGTPYLVSNLMSSLTEDCDELVSWIAVQQ